MLIWFSPLAAIILLAPKALRPVFNLGNELLERFQVDLADYILQRASRLHIDCKESGIRMIRAEVCARDLQNIDGIAIHENHVAFLERQF